MIPAQQQETAIRGFDKLAAGLAAKEIADWFGQITADELMQHVLAGADVAAMLPVKLDIPPGVRRMGKYTLLPYLRGTLRSPGRSVLYEEMRRQLANRGFKEHALVLAWGSPFPPFNDPRVKQLQLQRFPDLAALSSVLPWYHANMDRVLIRLVNQLEGGDTHDERPEDRDSDSIGGAGDSGRGVPGGLVDQEGEPEFDVSGSFSVLEFGGGYGSGAD